MKYFPLNNINIKNIIYLCIINKEYDMEAICVIKDIYKTLYQFEKTFSDVQHSQAVHHQNVIKARYYKRLSWLKF